VKRTIAVITGDGIGPEIMDATLQVLDALDCGLAYDLVDAGLSALETQGSSFPNTPWRASQDTASR
jgi:isocitrate dehydrogenase (NAD+)